MASEDDSQERNLRAAPSTHVATPEGCSRTDHVEYYLGSVRGVLTFLVCKLQ
jgi:hypothetical protein